MKKLLFTTLLVFTFSLFAKEAEDFKSKGIMAFNDNFYSIASNYFTKHLQSVEKKNPEFAEATVLLTRSLMQEQRYQTATEVLKNYSQALLPLNQKTVQAELDFWTAYLALTQKKYQEADQTFRKIYRTSDDKILKIRALASLAESMFQQKKYRQCKDSYLKLVSLYENTPQGEKATAELVKLFLLERDFFWAEREIKRMKLSQIRGVKSNALALEVLFESLKGNNEKALQSFQKATTEVWSKKRDNNIYLALYYLGGLLVEKKDFDNAVKVYTTSLNYTTTTKQTEQAIFKIANANISNKKTTEAIKILVDYTRTYPKSTRINEVTSLIGSLYKKNKEYSAALQYFDKVIKSKTASSDLKFKTQLEIADCFVSVNSPDKAITAFLEARKMAETSKDKAKSVFMAAEEAYRTNNYQQAIMYYQLIIEEYNDSSYTEHAYFYQGLAYEKEGKLNEAAIAFQTFLKNFPSSSLLPAVLFQYAAVLKQQGKNMEAASYFEKLVKLYPNSRNTLKATLLQSDCLTASGKTDDSLKLLQEALEKYEKAELHPYVYSRLVNLLLLTDKNDEALKIAGEFFKKYGKTELAPEIICRLGDFYKNSKDYINASKQYEKLAKEFPEDKRAEQAALDSAIACKFFDIPKALEKLTEISKNEKFANVIKAEALFEIGTIYSNRADYNKAVNEFAKISTLKDIPTKLSQRAEGRRGDSLFLANLTLEAAEVYTELLKKEDLNSYLKDQVRFKLAQSLIQQKKSDEAITILHDIIYQHNTEQSSGNVRDWRYFTRAAFELADLYVSQDKTDQAIKVLERIKSKSLPVAAEARTRIKNLQEKQADEQ